MSRLVATGFALLALLATAGCTSPSETVRTDAIFAGPEVTQARYECLVEKGWPVTLDEGAIVASIASAQASAYRADSEACLREAGIDPDAAPSDEALTTVYEWYSEIARCLTEAGWDVGATPTLATFKDSYETDPWLPWAVISDEEYDAALEACPVMSER